MMKPEDRGEGGGGGQQEREREIVCQNVDVWRLGFQPCQMIKMFPLTFIFPYLDPCLRTLGRHEYECRDGHIEFDLRSVYGWKCNLDALSLVSVSV